MDRTITIYDWLTDGKRIFAVVRIWNDVYELLEVGKLPISPKRELIDKLVKEGKLKFFNNY